MGEFDLLSSLKNWLKDRRLKQMRQLFVQNKTASEYLIEHLSDDSEEELVRICEYEKANIADLDQSGEIIWKEAVEAEHTNKRLRSLHKDLADKLSFDKRFNPTP